MPEVILDLEVYCSDCGAELDLENDRKHRLQVKPCQSCMGDERAAGKKEGKQEAESEGLPMPHPWEEELREGRQDCPVCEPGGRGAPCVTHDEEDEDVEE